MRQHGLLIVLIVVVLIALVVDLIDGYTPKTLSTGAMAIGLIGALGYRLNGSKVMQALSIAGFVLFATLVIYRAAVFQGWVV